MKLEFRKDIFITAVICTNLTLLTASAIDSHFSPKPPLLTRNGSDWTLQHIPMPSCPDDSTRTVDIPERDEVDALTVTCVAHNPSVKLGTGADGRMIDEPDLAAQEDSK